MVYTGCLSVCHTTSRNAPPHRTLPLLGLFLAERVPRSDLPGRGRLVRLGVPRHRRREPALGGGRRQLGRGAENILVRGARGWPADGGGV